MVQYFLWAMTGMILVVSCLFVFAYYKSERGKSDKSLLLFLLYVSNVPMVLAWIIELQQRGKVILNTHDAFSYFVLGLLLLLLVHENIKKNERTALVVETIFLVYLLIVFLNTSPKFFVIGFVIGV